MIFVTVGTQLPFDRLIAAVDRWAEDHKRTKIVAQIGDSRLRPQNMEYSAYMTSQEFRSCFESSDIVISHAGMGTILTSLDLAKQLVIVPRLAALREHRNDHQLATAEKFKDFPLVHTLTDLVELSNVMDQIKGSTSHAPEANVASAGLLQAIQSFLTNGEQAQWAQSY